MIITSNLNQVIFSVINHCAARRDAEGAVITDPRNFTTKNVKKGHIDSVLFSKPDYVSIGTLYFLLLRLGDPY